MPASPVSAAIARIETESPEVIMLRGAERTSGDKWMRQEIEPA